MTISSNNKKIENVLLCNMSTLQSNPKTNYYYHEDGGNVFICDGISQLEAGTKYLLHFLHKKGRKIDRIVITCSDATLKPDKRIDDLVAVDVYKEGIKKFINESGRGYTDKILPELRSKIDNAKDLDEDKKIELQEIARRKVFNDTVDDVLGGKSVDSIFEIIPIEKKGINSPETIENINKAILGDADSVNVLMDVQGGDRSFMYVLNAILAMNGQNKVHAESAIYIDYLGKSPVHMIGDAIESYRSVEFVAALKAFINYGRGELLLQYFYDDEYGSSSKDAKFVRCIKNISGAIQISSPEGLTEAIEELSGIIADGTKFSNAYLNLVAQDMLEDYGDMIKQRHGKNAFNKKLNYLEIIDWCNRKGFVQQVCFRGRKKALRFSL